MKWTPIKLNFWMTKGNSIALVNTINRWWLLVIDLLNWPLRQVDVDTADMALVDLLAWERDVQRFNAEPDWLYRKRVKYAHQNAKDAGSVAGFRKIWQRMGLGYVQIEERIHGQEWDIVRLIVSESDVADRPELLNIIIDKYGLTCRRYELTTISGVTTSVRNSFVSYSSDVIAAKIEV